MKKSFEFGLTAAEEARAAKLHRESVVFDMVSMYAGGNIFVHYPSELQREFRETLRPEKDPAQSLVDTYFWPFAMAAQGKSELIAQWLLGSGLTCGAYDIDVPGYTGGDPLSYPWERNLERCARLPWLRQVTTASNIRQAKRDGVLGLYAFYQPVVPLARDLEALDRAYAKGLRALMLTYNRMDHVGVGCIERIDGGLSMFGVDVVRRCNDLGIMVDVSHCGHLTTLDACRHSRMPVNANHTAARSLYDHPRGKSNAALRAIAATGGVIGIAAVPYFLAAEPGASIERLLDHVDYVVEIVGWEHVGLGTDWPLQAPDDVLRACLGRPEYGSRVGVSGRHWRDVTSRLRGFEDCRDWPNITRGLVKRGYSDQQVRGILGENALRVFEQVCG